MGPGTSATIERRPDGVHKSYRSVRARDQERRALLDWAPHLPLRCPRVLAVEPDALLLEHLDGAHPGPGWREELDLAEALGCGLAALHALPFTDEDPLPLIEALPRRLAGWRSRCGDPLLRRAGGLLPDVLARCAPGTLRRVPCHRDVHPGNVLLGAPLALLDWEHAGPDSPWVDLLRTWEGLRPHEDPWLRALAAGAGLDLEVGWPTLRALGLVEGAGCLAWGARHGAPEVVARGHRLLTRLLD